MAATVQGGVDERSESMELHGYSHGNGARAAEGRAGA
jgi:hypothetical protein